MWRIRGYRWSDTLALWINGVFWLPRRLFWQLRLGSKAAAIQKLLKSPKLHWTAWPISLHGRYYWWGDTLVDVAGITWFLKGPQEEFPEHWLAALERGRVGIDVGAHRGYWTLVRRHRLPPNARVVLLEPDPLNFAYLVQNLRYNQAHFALPLPLAAWDKAEWLTLQGQSLLVEEHASFVQKVKPLQTGNIPGIRLDSLVSALSLPCVDWIKIDVEGAEEAVLRGAAETLRRFRPVLWIEMHGTWETLPPLLKAYGYTVKEEVRLMEGWGGHIWAEFQGE